MQPFGDSHRAHVALGLGGSSLQKLGRLVSLLGRAGLEIPVHLADPASRKSLRMMLAMPYTLLPKSRALCGSCGSVKCTV